MKSYSFLFFLFLIQIVALVQPLIGISQTLSLCSESLEYKEVAVALNELKKPDNLIKFNESYLNYNEMFDDSYKDAGCDAENLFKLKNSDTLFSGIIYITKDDNGKKDVILKRREYPLWQV